MQMMKSVQKSHSVLLRGSAAVLLVAAGILLPVRASSLAVEDFAVHMSIMGLYESSPPIVVSDHLIFSYQPPAHDHLPRYVAASFEHQDFTRLHVFSRNQHGVFVLAIPVPDDKERIVYRLRVDGVWLADPKAEQQIHDTAGRRLSTVKIPPRPESTYRVPAVDDSGRLELQFRGEPNQSVFVSGTFNNWDPFMNPMREISPGEYKTTLRVNPEHEHFYVFFVNGRRMIDPGNPETAYSTRDQRVSAVRPSQDRNRR